MVVKRSDLRSVSSRMQRAAFSAISHGLGLIILPGRIEEQSMLYGLMTMELLVMERASASRNWDFRVQPMAAKASHRFNSSKERHLSVPISCLVARPIRPHVMKLLVQPPLSNQTAPSPLPSPMKTLSTFLYQHAC